MEPLVSIALCTYNGGKYISQQLDSILHQTYWNLEIIVTDDCSTDDTFNIVSRYAKRDNRVKCFKNDVNIGFNKNFEYAIKQTSGDYVAISDQDDVWLPQKIELLLKAIGDKWLILSKSSYIDGDNKAIEAATFNRINPEEYDYKAILLANFVTGHTTLFKRSFVNMFLPVPLDGFYDWWLGFVALYHHKIIYLDDALTRYRVHDTSVMQRRINSGRERQDGNKTIYTMLSAFSAYKNLEAEDKVFIEKLREAYKNNLYRLSSMPLIRIVIKYYAALFPGFKKREGLSLVNFALKYSRRVKNYA